MARRKSRKARQRALRTRLLMAVLAVALLGLGALMWHLLQDRGGLEPVGDRSDFGDRLRLLAERRGAEQVVADDPIRKLDGVFVRTWRVSLPDEPSAAGMAADVSAEAAGYGATLTEVPLGDGRERRLRVDLGAEAFDVWIEAREERQETVAEAVPRPSPTATRRPDPPPGSRGSLAVILDDGGQRLDLIDTVTALPQEVALAVLPFLPHSAEVATALHRSGHEVWLHLPMEADGYPERNPGPGAVMASMSEAEIRTTVHSALNNVPHVVGVNNHMGSRATAELRVMTWIMQELKGRGIAFIDSRTSVHTVAEMAARAQGVPTNRRHVFLDNQATPAAVRRQLAEAVYLCRMNGEAIAIGHVTNRATLEVLAAELPTIAERGADLVAPSALVR